MRIIKKTISLAIFVMILSSGLAMNTVSAEHENPDEAQEDLDPLFETLNRTAKSMETSLGKALNVNFTQEENQNGNLSYNYREEALNESKEIATGVEEELSKPNSVFSEIEGEIGSDQFLEEYFVPLYGVSLNLTEYSERHSSMISNMSSMIGEYYEEEGESTRDIDEAFNNTHDHLDAMEEKLKNINATVQEKKGDKINLTGLERSIWKNELFLEEYRDIVGDIGYELELPPKLFIYGPEIAYPGSEFEIRVDFFDGEKFNTSANISLLLNGSRTQAEYDIDGSSYLFSYEVDWDSQLWSELEFSALINESNMTPEKLVVRIEPYPSSIELEAEKDAFYDENVTIHGLFETDAQVDLTDIELNASERRTSPESNGSFVLEFDSKEFRWGRSEIIVEYEGAENDTISASSENVTFEVSILTEITITDYTETVTHDDVSNFVLEGRLVNISNEEDDIEGLGSRDLQVYLNGEPIEEIQTDEEGFFNFSFSSDQELDTGSHVLSFSFEGSEMYRSVDSREIQFEVVEEGSFWTNPLLIGGIAILIVFGFGLAYLTVGKEEEEVITESTESEKEGTTSEIPIPSATAQDDITNAYRRFLDVMEELGFIELHKGKTHREIESEINSHQRIDELKKELSLVTDLFEKALFTDREIANSELEKFNSSLSKLMRKVLS